MKILLLNQFFWPDSSATSQLLTDLARGLAERGHVVTAICSERGGYAVAEESKAPPVRICRVKTFRFMRGTVGRICSYLTFYLGAAFKGLMIPRQDIVLSLTTPPLLPLLGTLIQSVRGSSHYIWEMDVYPDVAVDLGYFKADGIIDSLVGTLADLSRRRAEGILALGECMVDRLRARSNRAGRTEQKRGWGEKLWVAHNWADGEAIIPQSPIGESTKLTLLYSGNIGLAHEFNTILTCIEVLDETSGLQFVFRGSGARHHELAEFKERTASTILKLDSFVSRSSLSDSLANCDVGLVTQQQVCCGSVVPSKVYGLLAAGRPILFIGPSEATPARIIRQFGCGWTINPGSSAALASLLTHLESHREEVVSAGMHARHAFLEHFDMPRGIDRIVSILENRPSLVIFPSDVHSLSSADPKLVNR